MRGGGRVSPSTIEVPHGRLERDRKGINFERGAAKRSANEPRDRKGAAHDRAFGAVLSDYETPDRRFGSVSAGGRLSDRGARTEQRPESPSSNPATTILTLGAGHLCYLSSRLLTTPPDRARRPQRLPEMCDGSPSSRPRTSAPGRRRQSPVGTMAAVSTIRITARSGARVRCTTPLGTTKP